MGKAAYNSDGTFVPKQARALKTYESILSAAQDILEESGLDALNSNAVAERAGVSPPIFYRYFKDKHALLSVLCKRLCEVQDEVYFKTIREYDDAATGFDDLEEMLYRSLTGTFEVTRSFVGAHALRISMRSIPHLASILREASHTDTVATALRLRALRPEVSERDAYDRSRLALEIGYRAVEMLLEDDEMSREDVFRHTASAMMHVYRR